VDQIDFPVKPIAYGKKIFREKIRPNPNVAKGRNPEIHFAGLRESWIRFLGGGYHPTRHQE
jgi:hypothetical protein